MFFGGCGKLPVRVGECCDKAAQGPHVGTSWTQGIGTWGGDGEGADVTLRTGGPGGATGTSMEQVQPVGQQGVFPVHFLSVRCSVSDVAAIAWPGTIVLPLIAFFSLHFAVIKLAVDPSSSFATSCQGKGFHCSSVLHRQVGDGEPSWLLPTE